MQIPGNRRVLFADLPLLDAGIGESLWIEDLGQKYESVPRSGKASNAVDGLADALTPISWQPSGSTVILPDGTSVAASGIRSRGISIVDGVANLDGETITELQIGSGDGTVTLWSYAVPASTTLEVVAKLRCSANNAGTGLRCIGDYCAVAHRTGAGALAIDSQGPAHPWILDEIDWNPVFDTSSNTLRLRLTEPTGITYSIIARADVAVSTTDTSADPAPAGNAWDALLAQLQIDLNGKVVAAYVGPDITEESAAVLGTWPGRLGSTLDDTTANRFATVTYNGYRAFGPGTLAQNKSLDTSTPFAFQSIWAVTVGHAADGMDSFEELASGATSGAHLIRSGTSTSWYEPAGETHYTDGILSSAIPTSGNHIFEGCATAAVTQNLRVGGHVAAARVWGSPVPVVLVLSSNATPGERAAAVATMQASPLLGL